MPKAWKNKRWAAFIKQKGKCFYCNQTMWSNQNGLKNEKSPLMMCTTEHLITRGHGGSDRASNIVAACYFCNSERNRTETQELSYT